MQHHLKVWDVFLWSTRYIYNFIRQMAAI